MKRRSGLLLLGRRRMVVVVVEAGFADGDDARVRPGQPLDLVIGAVGDAGGIVRMDADGCPDVGVLLGHGDGVAHLVEPRAGADADEGLDAGRAGAVEDGAALVKAAGGDEVLRLEVAVAIDEAHRPTAIARIGRGRAPRRGWSARLCADARGRAGHRRGRAPRPHAP